MENKQTALNWILDKLAPYIYYPYAHSSGYDVEELIEQAKAMEKEQIIDARVSGFASSAEGWNGEVPCMKWSEMVRETKCEEYYNETYGK
jgi:hypothetical protein